jgi:hypothetical protein
MLNISCIRFRATQHDMTTFSGFFKTLSCMYEVSTLVFFVVFDLTYERSPNLASSIFRHAILENINLFRINFTTASSELQRPHLQSLPLLFCSLLILQSLPLPPLLLLCQRPRPTLVSTKANTIRAALRIITAFSIVASKNTTQRS